MQVEWENGLIKRFSQNDIAGSDWGAETADRGSFFTLTDRAANCKIETRLCTELPAGYLRRVEATMSEGRWTMDIETRVHAQRISVAQNLTCIDRSVFQDFVIRFKFTQSSFTEGWINNFRVRHESRNIWHQHEASEVRLVGRRGNIRITTSGTHGGKFRVCMYLRDEPGSWIAHARLVPREPCDLYWIRWANRFGRLSVGDVWSRRLLRWKWLKDRLWYLSERRGGRPALQAQGLAVLDAGERLGLQAECAFIPHPDHGPQWP